MKNKLIEGEDYYINEDNKYVFTEKFHLKRGFCCNNGCRHCPYKSKKMIQWTEISPEIKNIFRIINRE